MPTCLDSEGARVRTGTFASSPIEFRKDSVIQVYRHPICGDGERFNFTPASTLEWLQLGDLINIDFHAVAAQVVEIQSDRVVLRVRKGGGSCRQQPGSQSPSSHRGPCHNGQRPQSHRDRSGGGSQPVRALLRKSPDDVRKMRS